MAALNPLIWAVMGLDYALFVHGLFLLGYDSKPAQEGGPSPLKALAVTGSFLAFVTLTSGAWIAITANPFNSYVASALVSEIFAMFGLLWLGVGLIELLGLDLRWAGNIALMAGILQIINAVTMLVYWPITVPAIGAIFIQVILYIPLLFGFWAAVHGKMPLKTEGYIVLLNFVTTAALLTFFASGVFAAAF